jgi:nucleotide-binding universal stress UspA family protein
MFKRILVPLDGSRRAEQALPVAARLAQASGARVVLLRVVSMANQFANYVAMEPLITEREIDLRLEEAKDYLRNLAHSGAMHGVDTKTVVFFGQPAANILSVVDLQQIDLVVMCSHGYTGMTRWLMGSVAEKVAHSAPAPVLVLREGKPPLANLRPDGSGSLRILVPLDGSARAEVAIAPAAQLVAALTARGRGALHLTHVVVMPGMEQMSHNERETIVREAKQYLSSTVAEMRGGLLADYGAELNLSITWSVTIDDDIAAGIVRVAENGEDAAGAGVFGGCDVIAMATHGYSGLQRLALGSMTERVLHSTTLPLLIIRPPDVVAEKHYAEDQPMVADIAE